MPKNASCKTTNSFTKNETFNNFDLYVLTVKKKLEKLKFIIQFFKTYNGNIHTLSTHI